MIASVRFHGIRAKSGPPAASLGRVASQLQGSRLALKSPLYGLPAPAPVLFLPEAQPPVAHPTCAAPTPRPRSFPPRSPIAPLLLKPRSHSRCSALILQACPQPLMCDLAIRHKNINP
jgi:hypothetical protein